MKNSSACAELVQADYQSKDLKGLDRPKLVELMAAVRAAANMKSMEAEVPVIAGVGIHPEEVEDPDVVEGG